MVAVDLFIEREEKREEERREGMRREEIRRGEKRREEKRREEKRREEAGERRGRRGCRFVKMLRILILGRKFGISFLVVWFLNCE